MLSRSFCKSNYFQETNEHARHKKWHDTINIRYFSAHGPWRAVVWGLDVRRFRNDSSRIHDAGRVSAPVRTSGKTPRRRRPPRRRIVAAAGEALNGAVYDTFLRLTGIRLMEGFGQTETTLTLATFPWMESKPGSMGVPNPQYRIDLLTPDGRSAEDGEQGQIVIRTDRDRPFGLFKGYYRNEELTRQTWHDGVYYTGDVAWRDEDGYYWFAGRADDVIKSSGYRIGPFEVESALMTHPAVVECAITGVPDEIRGQVVKATVVLAEAYRGQAGEALVKELQDHVKRITAPYKYPRVVEFVESLPKTISGKIRRKEIRIVDERK
nr:AMP-binding protein [Alistipes sp.]